LSSIYLIRHGQATVARFNYDNLSVTGMEQAELLGLAFRKRVDEINQVRYGTMRRHLQTLEAFRSNYIITAETESHHSWNEYDHYEIIQRYNPYYRNRWVMLADMMRKLNPRRDFARMFFKAMDKWMSGQFDEEYNESWPQFKQRTASAFDRLLRDLPESRNAAVITSGGVISSIILRALDLPDSYFMRFNKRLVNCSVTKFVRNREGVFLSTLNDHSAFEHKEDMITYI
jgi:broad specificity phosphatase PhoE